MKKVKQLTKGLEFQGERLRRKKFLKSCLLLWIGGELMSWYKRNIQGMIPQQNKAHKEPCKGNVPQKISNDKSYSQEITSTVTLNLTILDMDSENDHKIISKRLLQMPGIVNIKPYQNPQKLIISYNPYKISIEQIIFEILSLGYQNFVRA
ncbi:MAG: hypothetical protein PWP31_410 [Clostridia bacterium]|nr:hypothetical protein [Clostridia bacterium]